MRDEINYIARSTTGAIIPLMPMKRSELEDIRQRQEVFSIPVFYNDEGGNLIVWPRPGNGWTLHQLHSVEEGCQHPRWDYPGWSACPDCGFKP